MFNYVTWFLARFYAWFALMVGFGVFILPVALPDTNIRFYSQTGRYREADYATIFGHGQ